ncbi:MAG: hypothetical protein Q9173_003731 [Seirophora scorigena]
MTVPVNRDQSRETGANTGAMKTLLLRCVQTCRKAFMACFGLGGRKAPEDEEATGGGDEVVDDNDNDEEADEEADAAGDEEDDEEEEEEDEERRPLFNEEFNRRLMAHGGRSYVLNVSSGTIRTKKVRRQQQGDAIPGLRLGDYAEADYKVLAK